MENDTEIKSQNLLPVIKEYESAIDTLTTQLEFYASEQEQLRKEITALISENKLLSQTVHELLEARSGSYQQIEEKVSENELVENLKNQLSLTLKEKDTVVQLWQNALKNIDHLEEELKLFEGRSHGYFSKSEVLRIKHKYENQIRDLEEQLLVCQSKLDAMIKISTKNLESKNNDLEKTLEDQKNTTILAERLENEVKQLQQKLKQIMTLRDELQATLDSKNDLIEELKIKDIQARAKVTEAIQIVEAAFFEKDAAILREREAKEEVIKISKALSEVIDETAQKVKTEIENVAKEHGLQLTKVQQNIKHLKEKLSAKNNELEKYMRECKLLEDELQRIKNGNIFIEDSNSSKLLMLEKNLESTFQKLLLSERNNLKATAEKESIKADLEQMANCYENDIKRREIEKQILTREVQTLKKQLKISNSNLIAVAGEVENLNSKIKLLDVEMRDKLQGKDIKYRKVFVKTMEAVENRNVQVQNEMQEQVDAHQKLIAKWRNEMREVIDKFENRMKDLKAVNRTLGAKLKVAVAETLKLKGNIADTHTNVNKHIGNIT